MVPRPPEVIQERGFVKQKCWAAHIWFWPTSETTTPSPFRSLRERPDHDLRVEEAVLGDHERVRLRASR